MSLFGMVNTLVLSAGSDDAFLLQLDATGKFDCGPGFPTRIEARTASPTLQIQPDSATFHPPHERPQR